MHSMTSCVYCPQSVSFVSMFQEVHNASYTSITKVRTNRAFKITYYDPIMPNARQ